MRDLPLVVFVGHFNFVHFLGTLKPQPNPVPQTPPPVYSSVKAFAPATVANLGPGFDFLAAPWTASETFFSLSVDPTVLPGEIFISDITSGDRSSKKKLSKNPLWNCAIIAAIEVMKMLGVRSVGLSLSLHKGLPLGSGLGFSAASAAAAAVYPIGCWASIDVQREESSES